MRVFLRTKKKNCSVTRNHFGLAGPTGDSKGTWVFFNTFSKAIQPRFYELRKIWDMTLTWIFSDFKKMFRWNVSQTCDFPILLQQQILFGTTKYPSKKKIPFNFKKEHNFPQKKLHPKFHCFCVFVHPFGIPGQLFVHLNTCYCPNY